MNTRDWSDDELGAALLARRPEPVRVDAGSCVSQDLVWDLVRGALDTASAEKILDHAAGCPDCTLALPSAKIAVVGPSAAVNAVFYNQLQAIEDEDERAAKRAELMDEYAEGVDLLKLASEMVIDAIIQPEDLRAALVHRYARYAGKVREWPAKRNAVPPA